MSTIDISCLRFANNFYESTALVTTQFEHATCNMNMHMNMATISREISTHGRVLRNRLLNEISESKITDLKLNRVHDD